MDAEDMRDKNFLIWPAPHLPNRPLPCLTADTVLEVLPTCGHQLTDCITNMLVWPNHFNYACSCPVRCSPMATRQTPPGPRTETAWVHPRNMCAVTAVQSSLYPAYTQGAFLEGAAGAALAVEPCWAKCRPECRYLSGNSWGRRTASQNHVGFGVSAAGDIQLSSHKFFRISSYTQWVKRPWEVLKELHFTVFP